MNHDLPSGQIAHPQGITQQPALVVVEQAAFMTGGNKYLDLFRRMSAALIVATLAADQTQYYARASIDQPNGESQNPHRNPHRPGGTAGYGLGILNGQGLRQMLAQNHPQGNDER